MVRLVGALFFALCALPQAVNASTCEYSFIKKGNLISGLKFITSVDVADLSPASALGQTRKIALLKSYKVLGEEASEGRMILESPASSKTRSFPIFVMVKNTGEIGTVTLYAKLPSGMVMKNDIARTEMCAILDQIKGGEQELAVVENGILTMSAQRFSNQISEETNINPAAIPARYKGKSFTLYGTVFNISPAGELYRVAFKINDPQPDKLRLADVARTTEISCTLAKAHSDFALGLKLNDKVKLTGTYDDFNRFTHVIWLKDCRPAN
jgi:hypothetical protein